MSTKRSPEPSATLPVPETFLELGISAPVEIQILEQGASSPDSLTPEHPQRYVSSFEVGRGGIGRVFIASDRHLNRSVAVKELLLARNAVGNWRRQTELRFIREARITGQLEHPNIIGVHELGKRADGSLYYTMPVIQGRTLAKAIEECTTLVERLALMQHFRGACQAVAYAHSRGVIHRDIKPENVMIGQFGETIVLDWGLAKVTQPEPAASSAGEEDRMSLSGRAISLSPPERELDPVKGEGNALTLAGTVFGTPSYMSPEQALGQIDELDERTDVWSLGAVLFTMLSGYPPFDGSDPQQILRRVLTAPVPDLEVLEPEVPPELVAIVRKALCRDLAVRYATASELLAEVEAYLSGARVRAYRYSWWESASRWISRNRAAFAVAIAGTVSLLTFAVVYQVKLLKARDEALLAEKTAQSSAHSAAESARKAQLSLASLLVEKASNQVRAGDAATARDLARQALAIEESPLARGIYVSTSNVPLAVLEVSGHFSETCSVVSIDRTGESVACLSGARVALWSAPTGRLRWQAALAVNEPVSVYALDRGRVLVVARGGELEVLDGEKVQHLAPIPRTFGSPLRTALSPDAAALAIVTSQQKLLLLDLTRGTLDKKPDPQEEVSTLSFSRDGSTLALGGKRGGLVLLPLGTGESRHFTPHSGSVVALSFSPDGRFLATGSSDRTARVWNLKSLEEVSKSFIGDGAINAVDWSADSRTLVFGGEDRGVRVVDLRESAFGLTLPLAEGAVRAVQALEDGARVVSVTERMFRVWRRRAPKFPTRLVQSSNILSLSFDRTGDVLAAGLRETGICAFDLQQSRCSTRLPVELSEVRTLSFEPKRRWLAAGGTGGDTMLWDLNTKLPIRVLPGNAGGTRGSAFSADGRYLATVGKSGALSVFEPASGAVAFAAEVPSGLSSVVWSSAQHGFVVGRLDGKLQVIDPVAKRLKEAFPAHSDWILAVDVALDGSRILSAGADGRVRLWDARTLESLQVLSPHPGRVFAAAFSADGRLVASAGEGNTVFVWAANKGELLAILADHQGPVRAVRFAAGKPILASASDDGTVRLWDLSSIPDRR
ncbi:MAG: protein kinase [Polyangiaceae bacterium]|nr:protein kinase [Polyangiaceae bacterium]